MLRTAEAGSHDAIDAHLEAYEAWADLAMLPEARAELGQAASAVDVGDAQRTSALRDHRLVLALLEGDYATAATLLGAEIGGRRLDRDWLPRFLLRRELGFTNQDEADFRARTASDSSGLAALALILLLLDHDRVDAAKAVPRNGDSSLVALAMAAEAASLMADRSAAEDLYVQLLPFAGRLAIAHRQGSVGAVDRYLGLAADTLGQLDDAVRHLDAAIRINERMQAAPWQARAQRDLAQVLDQRRAAGDAPRAVELRTVAEATASALGMTVLLMHLRPARQQASVPEASGRSGVPPVHPPAVASAQPPAGNLFRRDGEYWTVRYDGVSFSLRDTKGMQYLGRLLAAPGVEFHVLDLATDGAMPGRAVDARTSGANPSDLASDGLGDAGAMLDAKARDEYRSRLGALDTEIAEAEAWNDSERVAGLQAEREFLLDELSAAVGLGGRSRNAASASERARLNVGKTIRSAIDRIETHNPALGRHLSLAVHTGTFCSYTPDPALNVVWSL